VPTTTLRTESEVLLIWDDLLVLISIKKRRKRMRKKKHKKMLKATRWQRRAGK
jgi:hypothetical protein